MRMLVNTPQGYQSIVDGIAYFDPTRVVWSEVADGPLPEFDPAQFGGLVRDGDALAFDAQRKAAHDAALAPAPDYTSIVARSYSARLTARAARLDRQGRSFAAAKLLITATEAKRNG